MWITFENELGSIHMSGGSKGMWRITNAEGLYPVQYDAQTVSMSGQDGQKTLSLASMARTISLKGDISAKESPQILTKASEIFSRSGYIKIVKGTKKRKIAARCTAFIPEREYGGIRQFVLQFICDDPFFTDFEENNIYIQTVEKLLYGGFTLGDGIIFSTGNSSAVINNMGTKATQPVIEISNPLTDMAGSRITVSNETTGQKLTLNIKVGGDDLLVIDIPGRKIMLNGDDRLDILSEDSFLSDFHLESGRNTISVETGSNSDRLTVKCIYDNRYDEAIV